jgi:hypothetical protein
MDVICRIPLSLVVVWFIQASDIGIMVHVVNILTHPHADVLAENAPICMTKPLLGRTAQLVYSQFPKLKMLLVQNVQTPSEFMEQLALK